MPDLDSVEFFNLENACVRKIYDETVLPPNNAMVVIAEGGDQVGWKAVREAELTVPAGYICEIEDAYLSGHACLWKENRFISLNSYVSFVAEAETRGGAWQTPWTHQPTRTIEERVAIGFSAGYGCFGHWLVDDIPRLGLLKEQMGADFNGLKIILPFKTPQYAKTMLQTLLGIKEQSIIYFNHEVEMLRLSKVLVSSYQHVNYDFNPYIKRFYTSLASHSTCGRGRFVCLSRRAWEKDKTQSRRFLERRIFEAMAEEAGFELVEPQTLGFDEQVALMSDAAVIIGEHGSAQHMSLFAPPGCVIGTINPLTPVQSNIGRLYGNRDVLLIPDEVRETGPGSCDYSCSKKALECFFEEVTRASH